MDREFVSVRMADLSPLEAYEVITSAVVPRPIAFVSTCNEAGVPNLAPFSFFMAGGSNPPSVMYSPTLREDGQEKDSLRNVLAVGEFVINTVHREMAEGMMATSIGFSSDVSEWTVSGYTPLPSTIVKPPRVLESLAQLECKLFRVVGHGDGPGAARYVIGEVVAAHFDSTIAADPAQLRTISRLGGRHYADLASMECFQP